MSSHRVYSQKEVSALIKRAGELQREEGQSASGLSLEDLEQIGREVGIDPEYFERAARELESRHSWEGFHPLGAPTAIDVERIYDGEVDDEAWDEMVAEIRRVYGTTGVTGDVGRTREWTLTKEDERLVHVTASPAGGRTRVRVLHQLWIWAVSLYVPIMGSAIAPIAILYNMLDLSAGVETGMAAGIAAGAWGIARSIFVSVARRRDEWARRLLDDLSRVIETSGEASEDATTREADTERSERERLALAARASGRERT